MRQVTKVLTIMKKMAVLLLLALAGSVALAQGAGDGPKATAASESAARASKVPVLTREQADKLLAQPRKVLVIDLRRPDEISSIGGLPVYLSIQPKDLESSLAWIPRDRSIITVSNHTTRSGKAADLLLSKGFKVVGILGAQLYEQQGGTLTRVPVPARAARTAAGATP
jgi:rhodanese-related sulfurtransferase